MDLKRILELLVQEQVAGDEMTGSFLDDAVNGFASNPMGATIAIRQLQTSDPLGFVRASVRLLISTKEETKGMQYVAQMMSSGNLLIDVLMDPRTLTHKGATVLAHNLATSQPLLDAHLIQKMLAGAGGNVGAVKADTALRVLSLVDEISDCSRLSSYLIQLMRHPNAYVRSKVVLLLGRANLNLNRVNGLLTSGDARERANVIEALWGRRERQVLAVLQEASNDKQRRVAINALVGLCQAGDRDSFGRLTQMAGSTEAVVRAGAAWAMGEIGDSGFTGPLNELVQDRDEKVRNMAANSLKKMHVMESLAAATRATIEPDREGDAAGGAPSSKAG